MLQLNQVWRPIGYLLEIQQKKNVIHYRLKISSLWLTYRIIKRNATFSQRWHCHIGSPCCRIARSAQKYFWCTSAIAWLQFIFALFVGRHGRSSGWCGWYWFVHHIWCVGNAITIRWHRLLRWLNPKSLQVGSQHTKFTERQSIHVTTRNGCCAVVSASSEQFRRLQHFIN